MNNFVTDWDNIVITCINNKITKPPSKIYISLNSKIFATVINSSGKHFCLYAIFSLETRHNAS